MHPDSAALVRQSWSSLLPRRKPVCAAFYRRLFSAHPELRPLFKGDMDRQAALFVTMINTVISALDDPRPVRTLLQTAGARHADYGVTAGDYRKFEAVLLDTLDEAMEGAFTPAHRVAWAAVFEQLAATMQSGVAPR